MQNLPKDAQALASDAKRARVETKYDVAMLGTVIRATKAQRTLICNRWEVLLCARPHRSPLADPKILKFMIPETCDKIMDRLTFDRSAENSEIKDSICPCGKNPMMEFYAMGELAMKEGLLRALRTVPALSIAERRKSLKKLQQVLLALRVQEIDLFCSFCQLETTGESDSLINFRYSPALDKRSAIHP